MTTPDSSPAEVLEAAFYCFYCDASSDRLVCKVCGNTARTCTPVDDSYFRTAAHTARSQEP